MPAAFQFENVTVGGNIHIGDIYDVPKRKLLRVKVDSTFPHISEVGKLLETITHFNEIFGGIEFEFDSDADIDVFIGIFPEQQQADCSLAEEFYTRCSNIQEQRHELLVFIKRSSNSHVKTSDEYRELKRKLLSLGNIYFFSGDDDLTFQFSQRFLSIIRGPLFDKSNINEQHFLPMNALRVLSQSVLGDYIDMLGQGKYLKDVYVNRELETEITHFIKSDEWFTKEVSKLLDVLENIALQFGLTGAHDTIISSKSLFLNYAHLFDQHIDALETLKIEFSFPLIEKIYQETLSVVSSQDISVFQQRNEKLWYLVSELPYLNARRNDLKNILVTFESGLREIFRRGLAGRNYNYEIPVRSLLSSILPGKEVDNQGFLLVNDFLRQLNILIIRQSKRCLAIVGKAGFGKTNLICNFSNELSNDYPVIIFNGNFLGKFSSVDDAIRNYWGSELERFFDGWLSRLVETGEALQQGWLFIFIDGINEHDNIVVFAQRLKLFIGGLKNVRVKVIVTCRDVLWEMFAASLEDYLFAGRIFEIGEYQEIEWQNAIQQYFKKYSITSGLTDDALSAFRNPLLLRFLCEIHAGKILNEIIDINLISVFDLYLRKLNTNINRKMGLLGHDLVMNFLMSITNYMWEKISTHILVSDLGVTKEELARFTSLYNVIRDENVILTDFEQPTNMSSGIRFVYDTFLEYILAKGWVNRLQQSKISDSSIDQLLSEIIERMDEFPAALNAVVLLDNMLNRDGIILCQLLKYISFADSDLLVLRQLTVLNWFANIASSNMDDGLIIVLDKFEQIARDDIKEKLSSHIMRLLEGKSSNPVARGILTRILDLKSMDVIGISPDENEKDGENLLPPARYHYHEDTKINAIGLLSSSKDVTNYELVEKGIKSLGRLDLHRSLNALAAIDLATDELIYKMLSNYIVSSAPEYRIYCAWLLRARYGEIPATFLIRLLSDQDTRVYRYTMKLFDTRLIEIQLLEKILGVLEDYKNIKSWHLVNLLKLLTKRQQFMYDNTYDILIPKIVTNLHLLKKHSGSMVRVNAYKGLLDYLSGDDINTVQNEIQNDSDLEVRALVIKSQIQ